MKIVNATGHKIINKDGSTRRFPALVRNQTLDRQSLHRSQPTFGCRPMEGTAPSQVVAAMILIANMSGKNGLAASPQREVCGLAASAVVAVWSAEVDQAEDGVQQVGEDVVHGRC
jgi:hypothetical protein